MSANKKQTIDEVMKEMPEDWRYRWCRGGPCACMGCANGSGQLIDKGFTKADWEEWVAKNKK